MVPNRYPISLQRLIGYFSKLPGIGKRTAERLAFGVLNWEKTNLKEFAQSLATIQDVLCPCHICGNISETGVCDICADAQRDHGTICIVEHPSQISIFENTGSYRGVYHVLGGKLSPLSGKGPEDLRIKELAERIEQGGITELILAMSPDVEGEATAHYLAQEFATSALTVTRIAAGVPVGADLNFADSATLAVALNARRRM